jgi:hypothetical protein
MEGARIGKNCSISGAVISASLRKFGGEESLQ